MNNKNKKITATRISTCLLALNTPCNTFALEINDINLVYKDDIADCTKVYQRDSIENHLYQANTISKLSKEEITLIQNQEYNLLDYVKIENFGDKYISIEIKETNLDIKTLGKYTVTYLITDIRDVSSELTLNINVIKNPFFIEKPVVEEQSKVNNDNQTTIFSNDIVAKEATELKGHSVAGIIIEAEPIDEAVTDTKPSIDNNLSVDNNDSNIKPTEKPHTGDTFGEYLSTLILSALGIFFINRKNKKQAL